MSKQEAVQPVGFWGHLDAMAASAARSTTKAFILTEKTLQPIENIIDLADIYTASPLAEARHERELADKIRAAELEAAGI